MRKSRVKYVWALCLLSFPVRAGIALDINAEVILNENIVIDNVCQIVTSTPFGVDQKQQCIISSTVARELRIKNTGILDLTQCTRENQELVIGGQITILFEPGAQLVMGGGCLSFSEDVRVVFEPGCSNDAQRVRIGGTGTIVLQENAEMHILRGALVGIESIGDDLVTDITLVVKDAGKIFIGSDTDFGGGLQIGNIVDLQENGASVDFALVIDGMGAIVDTNSQGFLGLGAAIVDKPETAPNTWLIATTYNVSSIAINLHNGTFKHNQIYSGYDKLAGLLAIGHADSFEFTMDPRNAIMLGGGNIVQITAPGPIAPLVLVLDGAVNSRWSTGILSSAPMVFDPSKIDSLPPAATATELFNFLKMNCYSQQIIKRATLFRSMLGEAIVGYVDDIFIEREVVQENKKELENSLAIGTIGLALHGQSRVPRFYATK